MHFSNVLNAALTTAVAHALFDHQEWTPLIPALHHFIQVKLSENSLMPKSVDGRWIFDAHFIASGNFGDLNVHLNNPRPFRDHISYHGCVHNSTVAIDYHAVLSLDTASFDCTKSQTFPGAIDPAINNLYGIFDAHAAKDRRYFNHDLAWSTVYGYLDERTREKLEEMARDFGGLD